MHGHARRRPGRGRTWPPPRRRNFDVAVGESVGMDLPPCPVCGAALEHSAPHARARCPDCGFSTPVELDIDALGAMLREATPAPRGLEASFPPRSAVADGTRQGMAGAPSSRGAPAPPSPPPSTSPSEPPSATSTPAARPPDAPVLAPPPRPGHIDARRPPPPSDPRAPLEAGMGNSSAGAPTPLAGASGDARARRGLAARGELLK